MLKTFVAALAALLSAAAFAAVDANKATQAELEAIKGIGPAIAGVMVSERKKSEFRDWTDLLTRVPGVGDRSAAKFSEGGLTVNGKTYPGAPYTAAPVKTTAAKNARNDAKVQKDPGAKTKAKRTEKSADKAEAKAAAASAAKK